MIQCQICGKSFTTMRGLSSHLKAHKISSQEYYDKYLGTPGISGFCEVCRKPTRFLRMSVGYQSHCSIKCSSINPITRDKFKKSMSDRYGEDNPSKVDEFKEKKMETCFNNHGVLCSFQSKEVQEKRKETWRLKYGVAHPLKSDEIKDKIKISNMKKYGKPHHMMVDSIKIKWRDNFLNKHGVDNPSKLKWVKEKRIQTWLGIYGCTHPMMNEDVKSKAINTWKINYGEIHPLKNDQVSSQQRLSRLSIQYSRLLDSDRLSHISIPMFQENEYIGVDHSNKYIFQCVHCGTNFTDHLDDGHIPCCPDCYPKLYGISKGEQDVCDFVKSLGVECEQSCREIIPPLELDIYIPSHNLAIEFNGLYWHSESNGTDKNYHLNKTLKCQAKGINLIHIFEDEWLNNPEIIKSIIRDKLKMIPNTPIHNYMIIEVDEQTAFNFLNDNHIKGATEGFHLGLYINDILYSMITFQYIKNESIHISRLTTLKNVRINSAMNKFLSYITSAFKFNMISIEEDRRFGDGLNYFRYGFNLSGSTNIYSYYLSKNYNDRYDQQTDFTKDKIWDCGKMIYVRINLK